MFATMKVLDLLSDPKDKTETAVHQNIKKKQLITSQRRIPGLKLWRFNLSTGIIQEVGSDEYTSVITMDGQKGRELIVKDNHFYAQALNKKNSIRRFSNFLR